jgi:hypothetical protein
MCACCAVAKNSIFLLVFSIFVGKDRLGIETSKSGECFFNSGKKEHKKPLGKMSTLAFQKMNCLQLQLEEK